MASLSQKEFTKNMKKAFTMIELIIVLVVIGIIASYTIPRIKRDIRAEAINHMLTMIRYTQNLALHDSKHNRFDPRWQRGYWRFQIANCSNGSGLYYSIGTDINHNRGIDQNESAIDPSNGKLTFWMGTQDCTKNNSATSFYIKVSPNIFITQKYGIKAVTFNSCQIYKDGRTRSSVRHIGFDRLGRPYKSFTKSIKPNNWGYIVKDCTIRFDFIDSSINSFTITIPNESGYAYLKENKNL